MRPFRLEPFAQIFVNRVMVHGLVLPDISGGIDFHQPIVAAHFRRTCHYVS